MLNSKLLVTTSTDKDKYNTAVRQINTVEKERIKELDSALEARQSAYDALLVRRNVLESRITQLNRYVSYLNDLVYNTHFLQL